MKSIPLVESIQPTDFSEVLGYDDISVTIAFDNGAKYSFSVDRESDAADLVNGLKGLVECIENDIESGKIGVLLEVDPKEFGLTYR